MCVRMTTRRADFDAYVAQRAEQHRKAMRSVASIVGEKAITAERQPHLNDWTDRTGNLRHSLGFVVIDDGEIVTDGTQRTNDAGADAAIAVLNAEIERHPQGIVLIICAGMNYAIYVSHRGYDVLTTAVLKVMSGFREFKDKGGRL